MMTMMYYILGRAARLIVLDWTGLDVWGGWQKEQQKMEEDEKVK